MTRYVALFAMLAAPLAAQQPNPPAHDTSLHRQHTQSDSAFAQVQRRGQNVMGVDQYTSKHVFQPLPDGGRIELQREVDDSAGVQQIRRHLAEVAGQFAQGDFSAPFLVHDQQVPGTAVMRARRGAIRYEVRPLPRGGEIRITSRDRDAVAAVHEFLAFQRSDHRAGAH